MLRTLLVIVPMSGAVGLPSDELDACLESILSEEGLILAQQDLDLLPLALVTQPATNVIKALGPRARQEMDMGRWLSCEYKGLKGRRPSCWKPWVPHTEWTWSWLTKFMRRSWLQRKLQRPRCYIT